MSSARSLEIQVVGGLGNQFFGFAAGLVLARTLNLEPVVNLERVGFGSNLSRVPDLQNVDLGKLEGTIAFINSRKSKSASFYERARRSSRNFLPVLVSHAEPEYFDTFEIPREQIMRIPPHVRSVGGPFMDFAWADLAKAFGFPGFLLPKVCSKKFLEASKISTISDIAIHMRLGDYLKHPDIFPIAPESYFLNALDYLNYKESQAIQIFTDSPKLAQQIFPKVFQLGKTRIVDPKRELSALETMSVMSKYSKLITSNSTFSSWAGWFNPTKNVVTPIPHHVGDWQDNLPNGWKRINIK
jgi:hypothetical protein